MSTHLTSLRAEMRQAQDAEREQDAFYRIMFLKDSTLRTNVARGVLKLVQDVSAHPAIADVQESLQRRSATSTIVEKALILAALCQEPEFLHYVLDMEDVSSSAVSQFTVEMLKPRVETLLNGNLHMPEFVLQSLVDYTAL
jgi:hypothetical protein